jgi:transcriptional regulator with XRE-family HTH domain
MKTDIRPKAKRSKLAIAIYRDGRLRQDIAYAAGMQPSRLSQILSGTVDPTDDQAANLAEVLGTTRGRLNL